ncbi:MAG: CPBP family intramembrane glutamic endopeptidase [Acidimicrobiales bacterium]
MPAPSWRVVLAVVALGTGFVLGQLIGGGIVIGGGWDFDVSAALGSDLGRVAGQFGQGLVPDHNRIPMLVLLAVNAPLWVGFIGVPWLASRFRGLDWRRDLGWGMRPVDLGAGLAVGIVTQVALVPLLYWPLGRVVDQQELEEPARNLIALANSPIDVAALVVMVVIGAPLAEEIVFRGLLFRGIFDMERAGRFALVTAVAASSAIFAASHLQLLQFPGLFVIGAVAALGLHRTGRLGTAIWIHVGFNATAVVGVLREIY